MNKENRWDSMGDYHDDDVRMESYGEVADKIIPDVEGRDIGPVDPVFVDRVVQQVQEELGVHLKRDPSKKAIEIKIMAMHRFLDLIEKKLLSQREADKCYQRFAQMVDFYYGR